MISTIIPFTSAAAAKRSNRRHAGRSWIYIACWRQRGPTKVGITDDPTDRLSGLQTGCPYKLHIWRCFGVGTRSEAATIEARILNRLRGVRLQGEWIDASVLQVEKALRAAMLTANVEFCQYNKRKPLHVIKQAPLTADQRRELMLIEDYGYTATLKK